MPATFKYIIRENRTNKRGECVIYLRITCNRKKKYHNTGTRIEPKYLRDNPSPGYWIKKSHPNYQTINEDLDLIIEDAKKAARMLRREDKESAENIKARLVGASKDDFFAFAYDHVDQLEKDDQFYLRKQTKATLSKLAEFNGSENLSFTEINTPFLEKFQRWMHKEKSNKGSTIRKNMGDMKRLLKLARKQHLIYRQPFEDFEYLEINDPGYKTKLSYNQIQKIEALDYPEGSTVWHARNAFILSFYFCGMRFGDLASLRWKNVKDGILNYRMGKTDTEIKVNIREQAQTFLDMYRTDQDDSEDFIFPFCEGLSKRDRNNPNEIRRKVSSWNANINQYLDDVAEDAKIDEDISMHVARHSFAQHGVSKGLSKYKMQMLLGHASVKTTERYLKKIDVDVINESMDIIF
jgi:site-specific recombinase XerD